MNTGHLVTIAALTGRRTCQVSKRTRDAVARINIDGAIADALADRGQHPHPHPKAGHLKIEALLGTYPMLEAWRQRLSYPRP